VNAVVLVVSAMSSTVVVVRFDIDTVMMLCMFGIRLQ